MSRRGPSGAFLAVLLVLTATLWMSPLPAQADCAAPAARSPDAFTGVVVATSSHDRLATVETEDGHTVEVRGGPGEPDVFTSLDRKFERGGRYEFHPRNATTPFEDDACTATRLVSRVTLPPLPEEPSQPALIPLILGGLLAGAAVVLLLVRVAVPRRSR